MRAVKQFGVPRFTPANERRSRHRNRGLFLAHYWLLSSRGSETYLAVQRYVPANHLPKITLCYDVWKGGGTNLTLTNSGREREEGNIEISADLAMAGRQFPHISCQSISFWISLSLWAKQTNGRKTMIRDGRKLRRWADHDEISQSKQADCQLYIQASNKICDGLVLC